MRYANLLSVATIYKKFGASICNDYLRYFGIKIKEDELNDLFLLVKEMRNIDREVSLYDKYFIGYSIPQIGKEFDLLRISRTSVLNIEIKSESTEEKIKRQLVRNNYYLKFLEKKVYTFCYESSSNKVYSLDRNNELINFDLKSIILLLYRQEIIKINNLDSYFDPSDYLVSPFNSTQRFVDGHYFLTIHQEEIRSTILKQTPFPGAAFYGIKGKAGTGKTLLAYDIAQEIGKQFKLLIVHCGILNKGHETLRDLHKWDIIPVKELNGKDLSLYEFVLVDEVQRMHKTQFDRLIAEIESKGMKCLFAYDERQTMNKTEANNNIAGIIEKHIKGKSFELTNKIRTNKEISSFISYLFDNRKKIDTLNYQNIDVDFLWNAEDVIALLRQLETQGYKVINFTPLRFNSAPYESYLVHDAADNAHTVIGQEFEGVAAVVDESFYYREHKLTARGYDNKPYDPAQMLYQIVSRTRSRLRLILLKNEDILKRCVEILKK